MTHPPSDETELAAMLGVARGRPLADLAATRDRHVRELRGMRDFLCVLAPMIVLIGGGFLLFGTLVEGFIMIGIQSALGLFVGAGYIFERRALSRTCHEIESSEPVPVVNVSSRLDETGTELLRTIVVGDVRWEERHRLDRDAADLPARVARHRVADERIRSELESGRLPDGIALDGRGRREILGLLDSPVLQLEPNSDPAS